MMTKEDFRRLWFEMKPVYMAFGRGESSYDDFISQRDKILTDHNITPEAFHDANEHYTSFFDAQST